ncbi:hypothetical protein SIPHO059v1_p0009 [Vibrio phage 264E42.1]|nr:hypothetical protein SIPHO059v1_p0009 [Vibrio phage 264E42.1]
MALPRSVKGFEKAIAEVEAVIGEIDQKLQVADADSSEEEDLLAEKAEKSIELEQLKLKFEEFKVSEQAKAEGKEEESEEFKVSEQAKAEGKDEESEGQDEGQEPTEANPEPEEEKWPETMYVAARNDIGFMVNPYSHDKITTDYKKVVVDNWTIAQVKAGILLVDKD